MKTRQQIIDELKNRREKETNTTRQMCLSSWLRGMEMWLDSTESDFRHSLEDAHRSNQITRSKAAGAKGEQERQDTLAIIQELQLFLDEGESGEAGPAEPQMPASTEQAGQPEPAGASE